MHGPMSCPLLFRSSHETLQAGTGSRVNVVRDARAGTRCAPAGGGRSVEDVAAAFGVTPQVVRRRFKLATVSPALPTLFREGAIGLDCLMVLASIDDPARQEQLWKQLPEWNRNADHLRRLLTRGEVESDRDGVAIFVTLPGYEAAGGPLRRDLFAAFAVALGDRSASGLMALGSLLMPAGVVLHLAESGASRAQA
jgi:hypothetical protein